LFQRWAPAFEALLLRGVVDAPFNVADGVEVFGEFRVVVAADLGAETLRVAAHFIENAAVELAPGAVAHEPVEGARRIDFLRRGFRGRGPRQAGAVDHRQAVFQAKLIRLDAEYETRDRGAAADVGGDDLV